MHALRYVLSSFRMFQFLVSAERSQLPEANSCNAAGRNLTHHAPPQLLHHLNPQTSCLT